MVESLNLVPHKLLLIRSRCVRGPSHMELRRGTVIPLIVSQWKAYSHLSLDPIVLSIKLSHVDRIHTQTP